MKDNSEALLREALVSLRVDHDQAVGRGHTRAVVDRQHLGVALTALTRPPAASNGDLEDEVAVFLRAYGDAFVREVLKQAAPVSDGDAVRDDAIDDAGWALYAKAYRHGYADARYDGAEPYDEADLTRGIDSVAMYEGWSDGCRDEYRAALASSPASSTDVAGLREALIAKLKRAKANGDPTKYLAGISVAEAHAIAALLEKGATNADHL